MIKFLKNLNRAYKKYVIVEQVKHLRKELIELVKEAVELRDKVIEYDRLYRQTCEMEGVRLYNERDMSPRLLDIRLTMFMWKTRHLENEKNQKSIESKIDCLTLKILKGEQ